MKKVMEYINELFNCDSTFPLYRLRYTGGIYYINVIIFVKTFECYEMFITIKVIFL